MERKYNIHLQYGEKFTTHLETLNSRPNWICYSCDQLCKTCFGESQFPQKQNIWKKFDLRQKSAVVSMHKYTWQLLISYNCCFLSTAYFLQRWFLPTVDFLQRWFLTNVDFFNMALLVVSVEGETRIWEIFCPPPINNIEHWSQNLSQSSSFSAGSARIHSFYYLVWTDDTVLDKIKI